MIPFCLLTVAFALEKKNKKQKTELQLEKYLLFQQIATSPNPTFVIILQL